MPRFGRLVGRSSAVALQVVSQTVMRRVYSKLDTAIVNDAWQRAFEPIQVSSLEALARFGNLVSRELIAATVPIRRRRRSIFRLVGKAVIGQTRSYPLSLAGATTHNRLSSTTVWQAASDDIWGRVMFLMMRPIGVITISDSAPTTDYLRSSDRHA